MNFSIYASFTELVWIFWWKNARFCCFLWMRYRQTDRPTDRRTQPIVEMRGRIWKHEEGKKREKKSKKKHRERKKGKNIQASIELSFASGNAISWMQRNTVPSKPLARDSVGPYVRWSVCVSVLLSAMNSLIANAFKTFERSLLLLCMQLRCAVVFRNYVICGFVILLFYNFVIL